MSEPIVTVLMAVYNGGKHLAEAIDSVLRQSLGAFEFIIVDDGSSDDTAALLASYDDPRLVRLTNEQNIGLAASLNRGLRQARGRYVARMDADDVSAPSRLERQIDFLELHQEVGLLGSACEVIDPGGPNDERCPEVAETDLQIRWAVLLANPFWHPTVVMRRDVLVRYGLEYDEELAATQDYDLWARLLRVTQGANLAEPLLRYRAGGAVTSGRRTLQLATHDRVSLGNIRSELPEFAIELEQVSGLRLLFVGGEDRPPDFDARRRDLAAIYVCLFEAFARRYRKVPGMKSLRCAEAVKMARLSMRPPRLRASFAMLRQAFALDPALPLALARWLVARRLGVVGGGGSTL